MRKDVGGYKHAASLTAVVRCKKAVGGGENLEVKKKESMRDENTKLDGRGNTGITTR